MFLVYVCVTLLLMLLKPKPKPKQTNKQTDKPFVMTLINKRTVTNGS